MDRDDFKPNSYKYKAQQQEKAEREVKKVISGSARVKKKGGIEKLADTFISEDAGNLKSYIIMDILIPTIKNTVSDIVKNGIDMILGIDSRNRRRGVSERVSYRDYYDKPRGRHNSDSSRIRGGYSYDDIILDSRGEAEEVLASMDDLIERYQIVSVADFYDLVGVTGSWTDNNFGWTDIRSAEVVRTRDGGYKIKMPRAIPLD